MRRRGPRTRRGLIAGGAFALLFALVIAMSVHRYSAPPPAPREALDRIAQKNRHAATVAAARQRAESAATSNDADNLVAAQERGAAEADAAIARYPDRDAAANNTP
jgi:hypothetical protein